MEYSLRRDRRYGKGHPPRVLILILMEYSLRPPIIGTHNSMTYRLNPYSNGI